MISLPSAYFLARINTANLKCNENKHLLLNSKPKLPPPHKNPRKSQ